MLKSTLASIRIIAFQFFKFSHMLNHSYIVILVYAAFFCDQGRCSFDFVW